MQNCNYIGYKIGDLAQSGAATATSGARVFASGGTDIAADIALVAAGSQFASDLFNQWFSHPAADARDFISKVKPQIVNLDAYNRIVTIMAADEKITHRAKDVSARELVLWYRNAYPNDYKTLTPEQKTYFNNYLQSAAQQATDVNQASRDYMAAKFNVSELNFNASPVQAVTNLFSSGSGKTNWVLYGAIALGLIVLIKNK